MTKPNKSAWNARQAAFRSASRTNRKSDTLVKLYNKHGLSSTLRQIRELHTKAKRESTKHEILQAMIDLARFVSGTADATPQMIDTIRETYLDLSDGVRYIKSVGDESLDDFQIIMKEMRPTKSQIPESLIRTIIREEILSYSGM